MQFLYWLPGETSRASLAYAWDGAVPSTRGCRQGPDGGAGTVAAMPGCGEIGYFPDRQTWRQIPGSPCWLGLYRGELPGPEDLARRERLGGYPFVLGDGREWLCPTALSLDDQGRPVSTLPKVRRQRDDGTIERRVVTAWEPLLLAADEVAEAFAHGRELDEARAVEIAVLALSANYRVTLAEVSDLGLLTDRALVFVLCSLVDAPRREALKGGA